MGLTNQETDALGNVSTMDRDANGLATITIDPLNRITQDAYDSNGNVTKITYPDGTTTTYGTYNSFAEPAIDDRPARTDHDVYLRCPWQHDGHGRRARQRHDVYLFGDAARHADRPDGPAPAGNSSYTLVSYQYDSQDRLTTITNADSDVTVNTYNSAGQVTEIKDPLGTLTTYSFDAMNRETGMTNAAGTGLAGITTYGYDAAGNQTTVTDAADETTTTTYDALDRVSTVEDADTGVTTYAYDNDGRLHVLTDPGRQRHDLYLQRGRRADRSDLAIGQ